MMEGGTPSRLHRSGISLSALNATVRIFSVGGDLIRVIRVYHRIRKDIPERTDDRNYEQDASLIDHVKELSHIY